MTTDAERLERLERWMGELVRRLGASTGVRLPRVEEIEGEGVDRAEAWGDVLAREVAGRGDSRPLTLERFVASERRVDADLLEAAEQLSRRVNGALNLGLRGPSAFLDDFRGQDGAYASAFAVWAGRAVQRLTERCEARLTSLEAYVGAHPELFAAEAAGAWLSDFERVLESVGVGPA